MCEKCVTWQHCVTTGSPFRVNITGEYLGDDTGDDAPKATPISPGLDPIMEDSDEEMVTSSEPNVRKKKKKTKKNKSVPGMMPMMPVLVMNPYMNLEPGQMPIFHSGRGGQVPYQLAFMQKPASTRGTKRGTKRTKKGGVKNSKGHTVSFNSEVSLSPETSSTNLHSHSNKMLTFSSLRVKKTKNSSDDVVPKVGGSFTGHASMNIGTVTKTSTVMKGIMKKSTSESSTSSRN